MKIQLSGALVALAFLMGCGDMDSATDEAKSRKSSEQRNDGRNPVIPDVKLAKITGDQLKGSWETPCVKENTISKILAYDFADGTYTYTTKYFKDKECKKATREWSNTGTYVLGGPASKPEGAMELDFVVEKSFITIRDEALVKQQNDAKSCGKADWQANVTAECPMNAEKVYTIVGISGDKMYFGDSRTGGADTVNRMSKADPTQPFAKK